MMGLRSGAPIHVSGTCQLSGYGRLRKLENMGVPTLYTMCISETEYKENTSLL